MENIKLESEDERAQIAGSTLGHAINITVGADSVKRFAFTGILVCVVLVALLSVMGALCLYAAWAADKANMHAELSQYYATELEGWMKEHGLHPPADPWQVSLHKENRK